MEEERTLEEIEEGKKKLAEKEAKKERMKQLEDELKQIKLELGEE